MGDDKKIHQKKIEPNKEVKSQLKLNIKSITIQGENGIYRVYGEGIQLDNGGKTMAFENEQQWEDFKKEFDKVFSYAKEKNILT